MFVYCLFVLVLLVFFFMCKVIRYINENVPSWLKNVTLSLCLMS